MIIKILKFLFNFIFGKKEKVNIQIWGNFDRTEHDKTRFDHQTQKNIDLFIEYSKKQKDNNFNNINYKYIFELTSEMTLRLKIKPKKYISRREYIDYTVEEIINDLKRDIRLLKRDIKSMVLKLYKNFDAENLVELHKLLDKLYYKILFYNKNVREIKK